MADQILELRQANESFESKTTELGDQVKMLEKIKEEMSVKASELKQQLETAKIEVEGKTGAEAQLRQRLTGVKMSLMTKQGDLDEVRMVANTRGAEPENLRSEHESLRMCLEKKEGELEILKTNARMKSAVFQEIQDSPEDSEPVYMSQSFFRPVRGIYAWLFDFLITRDNPSLIEEVQEEYKGQNWTVHHEQYLQFAQCGDEALITLHVSQPRGPGEEWELEDLGPLEISKLMVDRVKEKSKPPYCRLAIKWRGEPRSTLPNVSCEVKLEGTKNKDDFFRIELPERALGSALNGSLPSQVIATTHPSVGTSSAVLPPPGPVQASAPAGSSPGPLQGSAPAATPSSRPRDSHASKCRVLRKLSNKLQQTMESDLVNVKFELYANDLISQETRSEGNAEKMVSEVETGLQADEGVWERLVAVLMDCDKRAICSRLDQQLRLEMGEEAAGR